MSAPASTATTSRPASSRSGCAASSASATRAIPTNVSGFFLREALRGLRRSSAPALAALLTVVITALVLGVFIPIVQATTGTANEVRNRVVADVYLKNSATEADRTQAQRELEATPGVKSVEYISKDEAL